MEPNVSDTFRIREPTNFSSAFPINGFIYLLLAAPCDWRDLGPGSNLCRLQGKSQSPNHWATRKFLSKLLKNEFHVLSLTIIE